MLIGEAPGAEEDTENRPFVGSAGKTIDRLLIKSGLHRSKVYVSNAVKCRPPGNRTPDDNEAAACFVYLAEEIERVKPKVIVLVGGSALKAITGEKLLERARGRLLSPLSKIRIGGAKLIATYHPAAGMHNPGKRQLFEDSIVEDLKYAQNLVSPDTSQGTRTLLPEGYASSELYAALYQLRKATKVAVDLEWLSGARGEFLQPWDEGAGVLSMSITARVNGALKTVAFALPTKLPIKVRSIINAFLKGRPVTGHNMMADAIYMLSVGIEFEICGDSMLLAYLLDEHRRGGLKGLAPLIAGVEAGWEIRPWHRRPVSEHFWLELLGYNATDTENQYKLDEALLKQVARLPETRAHNVARVYRNLLLPAIKPFARIALEGTPLNRTKIKQAIKTQRKVYEDAIEELAQILGTRRDMAERLASSPEQVKRLAREFGLEVETSRDDELGDYVDQYPALRQIRIIKHARKLLSTYLEPWLRLTARDGRLHSVYLLGATRTGRLSAEIKEGGSLLLTPREPWVRDLIDIESEDDDFELLAADYSQIELRIIAWLAPERNMRRLFKQGADLHRTTAAFMISRRTKSLSVASFWKQRERWERRVTKEERQRAKGINFGFDFGMQEKHFGAYAKKNYQVLFTDEEAHDAREGYFELYNDLQPWHDRATREAEELGYSITPFGRYRFGLEVTQQINTPIQSTASDLGVFALTVVDERLRNEIGDENARLIGFVHDCLLVRSRKRYRAAVSLIIQETMEHPPLERVGIDKIPVPLVAEVQKGPTWAEAR